MTEKQLCFDCKHQEGTWVNDREVDTWCEIGKSVDEAGKCNYFEELLDD